MDASIKKGKEEANGKVSKEKRQEIMKANLKEVRMAVQKRKEDSKN
jgi:hypothetical protein